MLSVSKIKNKKSFFLLTVLFLTLNQPCYATGQPGSRDNPIHYVPLNPPADKNAFYWQIGFALLPVIATTTLNYIFNSTTTDHEMNNLIKQEKQNNLEMQKHPNYIEITLLQQKNEAEQQAVLNKQATLNLKVAEAQLLEHYEEKMKKYLQCAEKGTSQKERDFCADMYTTYSNRYKN